MVESQRKGELRPCYLLTKIECLYIATKFNDEARAKLVLRWQQLELAEQERRQQLCLPSPQKILALADEIIGEQLQEMNEPAEDTLTATQVAKTFNMTVWDFNCILRDMGIWASSTDEADTGTSATIWPVATWCATAHTYLTR